MGLFGDNRFVDLGLSVRWAKCNIGASAPYEIGVFMLGVRPRLKVHIDKILPCIIGRKV